MKGIENIHFIKEIVAIPSKRKWQLFGEVCSKFSLTIFLCFALTSISTDVFSQVTIASSDSVGCGTPCTILTASVTGYPSVSSGVLADDGWGSAINIGFTFNFYGAPYVKCIIGSNGVVGFDLSSAGSYNTWPISGTLASTAVSGGAGGDIHNLIAGVWSDLYLPGGGTINYASSGVAPNRKFVVNFCADHLYSCSAQWTTAQVILYETTNIVEVHIGQKAICAGWNGGYAETGVVNQNGSSCTMAPGPPVRDYPNVWSATDEAWRFTPVSGGASYTVASIPYAPIPLAASIIYWYNATTGAYLGTGHSITVCPASTTTYAVGALTCSDTSFSYYTVMIGGGSSGPISGNMFVCAGTTTNLSDVTTGGVWSSGSPTIATVDATGLVYGLSSGNAIISYSSGSCTETATVAVSGLPSISGPAIACVGSTVALSSMSASGAWSSSNTLVATINQTTGSLGALATGTTTITASNLCGTDNVSLVVSSPGTISGITTFCQTTTTTNLSDNISGGTWTSGNASLATIDTGNGTLYIVPPGNTGVVPITYTVPGGCFTTTTLAITPAPIAITGPANVCIGSIIRLSDTPTGGTWSSGSPGFATITPGTGIVSGISPGAAIITYSLGSGCIATYTVTVNVTIYIPSGSTELCAGSTITLSNATTGGAWSTGSTAIATVQPSGGGTAVIGGVAAGSANITYATAACNDYTTAITVNPGPTGIMGIVNICGSGTVMLSSSPGGGTWSSSNTSVATIIPIGPAGGRLTSTGPGSAVITYMLPAGCFTTTTVSVSPFPSEITGVTKFCVGTNTSLSDAAGGGVWTSSNTSVASIVSGSINGVVVAGLAGGVSTISYSTGIGCSAMITVSVIPQPNAGTIIGPAGVCVGSAINLSDATTGGEWSSGTTGIVMVNSGGVVTAVSPGVDVISYTVTNFCGLVSATTTINVGVLPDAGAITGDTVVCAGFSINLSDTVAGGTWSSNPAGIATITTGGVVTGTTAGVVVISYTVTNSCGSDTAMRTVTVYAVPSAGVISGITHVCLGAAFTLSETVAGGIWSSSDTGVATIDSNSGRVFAHGQGTDVISYTIGPNAHGCYSIATFTVTVTVQPDFTIDSTITNEACYGDSSGSIALTINGGARPFHYVWSNAGSDSVITNLKAGIYYVNVMEPTTQCIATDSFLVTQPDPLGVTSSINNDSCNRGTGSINLVVTGGVTPYSYAWSNSATGHRISGLMPDVYTVIVTDMDQCAKSISDTVNEYTCDNIIIHNVLTPNGDGVNDTWVIEGIENYPTSTVQVFDKWGDMVYEQAGYKNNWSGKGKNGILVPDGTYYYLVKLNMKNATGGKDAFTGYLMIKR